MKERPATTSMGYPDSKLKQLEELRIEAGLKSRNALISLVLDYFLDKYETRDIFIEEGKICLKK